MEDKALRSKLIPHTDPLVEDHHCEDFSAETAKLMLTSVWSCLRYKGP